MLKNISDAMSGAVVTKERFLQRGNFCACQAIFSVLSSGSKTERADRCFAWTVLDQPFVCRRLFTLIACVHNQILQGAVQYQLTLGILDSTYLDMLSEFTLFFQGKVLRSKPSPKKFNASLPLIYFPWSVCSVLIHIKGQLTFTKKEACS